MVSVRDDGSKAVSGGSGLKATQTYPTCFGAAVATVCLRHREALIAAWHARNWLERDLGEITMEELLGGTDDWADADLGPVFDLLMGIVHRKLGL